ncbi:MAG: NAD(P)-dependent oxidoreductase, partial [Cyclobacteriaceae bacterium]
PEAFKKKAPHLFTHRGFSFIQGDIKTFIFPTGAFDIVIHAATEASEKLNTENPIEMIDSIVQGTRNTLEFCIARGVKKMLFVSSGAVYGKQPPEVTHVDEDCFLGPDITNPGNAYAESKRLAELLCAVFSKVHGIDIPVARCFAFVGPYLKLDIHFAIGNFIKNGLEGKSIEIKGDGTPLRSYMYSADLVVWLLTILINGESSRIYNVGSDVALSIKELAEVVRECFNNEIEVEVKQKPQWGKPIEQYIPSVNRCRKELKLSNYYDLETSILKTKIWNEGVKY